MQGPVHALVMLPERLNIENAVDFRFRPVNTLLILKQVEQKSESVVASLVASSYRVSVKLYQGGPRYSEVQLQN